MLVKTESAPTRSSNSFAQESDLQVKKSQTLRLKKLNASMKVRPPLTALPAFTIDAIIFSFMGFEDEIFKLLNQLNNNGRLYAVAHADFLRPFLSQYKKEITGELSFVADMAKGVVKSKPENFVSTYILFWNQILPNSIKAV